MIEMKKISNDEVISEMKQVYEKNDSIVPTMKKWKDLSNMSADVVNRVFGTWKKAWTAIGIKYKEPLYKKRERIIIDLQRTYAQNKNIVKTKDLIRASGHTIPTIIKYFDSVCHAFGMAKIEINKRIPKERFMEDFVSVYNKLGRIPTDQEIRSMCKYHISSFRKHFGSIDNLAKIAGIEREKQNTKTSDKELLKELKRLHIELQCVPTLLDIHNCCKYSADTYQRSFGNFTNALNKIGLNLTKSKKINMKCPNCGIISKTIIAHMKYNHPEELKKHEEFVINLYKGGLSSRSIAIRDDILYNGASPVNRLVRKYLTSEQINELRKSKIKNTLKKEYASGKYGWVNDLNRIRTSSEEGKKKNSDGLKQAYESGKRESWNKGLTKETDERVAQSAQQISKSIKLLYGTGEIEKKLGPENSKWNNDRNQVTRRYRLGLDFSVSDRYNIKKRAQYKCQKCEITQEELEEVGKTLECDHIIPILDGGLKDWEVNGQALCTDCHKIKSKSQ
ncbi:hypothetical protein LCGC14_1371220 [marine sediment metagenome]|uniref:HNH domain-containing protein n=1 Tax=marine sediment metagenome TaxID=412755 RepID=A0A0F9K5G5_9ZZZZ